MSKEQLPVIVSEKFTTDEIALLRDTYAKGLSDTQLKVFLKQCEAMDLNPFTKEIYGMVISGKLVLITSINGLRKIAHAGGDYLGCKVDVEFNNGKPVAAKAVVKKLVKGHIADFEAEVMFSEFNTNNNNWKSMPTVMIKKVAEAAALRMAFPALESLYEESEVGAIGKTSRRDEKSQELTDRFRFAPAREVTEYPTEVELEPEGGKDDKQNNTAG